MIMAMLVEDEKQAAKKCVRILERCGVGVSYFSDAEAARVHLLDHAVDVAIIDMMLPPSYSTEGIRLLEWALRRLPSLQAGMITQKQLKTTELVADAMRLGARFFLDKETENFCSKLEFHIREILMERTNRVFISHGHNELLKLKLRDFLQNRFGKIPVILGEIPSAGLTVVEKLEKASDGCDCAVILMTKDDETRSGGVRARQNVIHEIGFFQGKYGRNRVVLLAEKGVELFSNVSGIVRIEFDPEHFHGVFELLRLELESMR